MLRRIAAHVTVMLLASFAVSGCRSSSAPAPTVAPEAKSPTPYATYTLYPTHTPYPTFTPAPTYTPFPTFTRPPVQVRVVTQTPNPSYTPYPTYTPFPAALVGGTPAPAAVEVRVITQTPNPTYTPYPTYTLYPVSTVPTVPPSPTAEDRAVYSWQEAGQHVGEHAVVEGTVVRTYNTGSVIFFNFVEEYQGTFTVVIFADDAGKFPQPPEQMFLDQHIRVEGEIGEYRGTPQIVVVEPAQIEIVRP